MERIRSEAGSAHVELVTGDLSDVSGVQALAEALTERLDRIDVLIHNAGLMTQERQVNADGLEVGLAVAPRAVSVRHHDVNRRFGFGHEIRAVFSQNDACWGILKKSPDSVMCASARMVVKRKGAPRPAVVACTLLPYDPQFELGETLAESVGQVRLNHPHCAKFCVLGGAACST